MGSGVIETSSKTPKIKSPMFEKRKLGLTFHMTPFLVFNRFVEWKGKQILFRQRSDRDKIDRTLASFCVSILEMRGVLVNVMLFSFRQCFLSVILSEINLSLTNVVWTGLFEMAAVVVCVCSPLALTTRR